LNVLILFAPCPILIFGLRMSAVVGFTGDDRTEGQTTVNKMEPECDQQSLKL
jgi:hypothetical protein